MQPEIRTQAFGQFHHYLPRFVARRWLQEVKVLASPSRKSKGRQRPREYKEELINTYDVRNDTLHMGTTDLGKTFGIIDMYKDDTDSTDVYRVEKAFSKLESDAARVFKDLEEAEKRGSSCVELARSQLNTLRKFLFLISYRNGPHSRQFIEGRFDQDTEAMVEEYRVEHGLADARAVWLRNLALLLEDEHWEVPTDERLLWTARLDYQLDAQHMQLGLYRAPPGVEFVLTENGLGLLEGAATPMHAVMGMASPAFAPNYYLPLTQTFPITPKLVVVLRSRILTVEAGLIETGVSAEEAKRRVYGSLGLSHTSYFHDLPRTLAKMTYIPPLPPQALSWVNKRESERSAEDRKKRDDFEKHSLLDGQPLGSRLRDRFVFAIDDLTEDQADRVNVLRLTHCRETMCFLTPAGVLRAIEAFERDRLLSIDRKRRYDSLKAQLIALQSPSPSSSTSPPPPLAVSPATPPEPIHMTGDSGSQPTVEANPLRSSLPGLRGALNRKARSAPASKVAEDVTEPITALTSSSTTEQSCGNEPGANVFSIPPPPHIETQTRVSPTESNVRAPSPAAAVNYASDAVSPVETLLGALPQSEVGPEVGPDAVASSSLHQPRSSCATSADPISLTGWRASPCDLPGSTTAAGEEVQGISSNHSQGHLTPRLGETLLWICVTIAVILGLYFSRSYHAYIWFLAYDRMYVLEFPA